MPRKAAPTANERPVYLSPPIWRLVWMALDTWQRQDLKDAWTEVELQRLNAAADRISKVMGVTRD